MLEAQLILENAGYTLDIDDVQVIYGAFYQLRYANYDSGRHNPSWVVLQYDTQQLTEHVPIALFYWEYGANGRRQPIRWGSPFDITSGAATSDAEKIMLRFEQSFDETVMRSRPVWVPVFDNKQGYA